MPKTEKNQPPHSDAIAPHNVIIRLPVVKQITGLSRSSIYKKISESTFPKSLKLGARACGWIESEIYAWVNAQIEASRGTSIKEVA